MKPLIVTSVIFTLLGVSMPVGAENLSDLSQLLSTKQCSQCDLSRAGLVQSDLAGADLRGADLRGANLSQANLGSADLSGANLTGASLYGANLSGANLTEAKLTGTDLREAYLVNADLVNVDLSTAYVEGAVGIPNYAATPEQFYNWGMNEAAKANYLDAIAHFNRALDLDPDFASAYLARGLTQYRLGKETEAIQDAEVAAGLFEEQENAEGYEAAQNFLLAMATYRQALENREEPEGGLGLHRIIGGIAPLLLRFLLP